MSAVGSRDRPGSANGTAAATALAVAFVAAGFGIVAAAAYLALPATILPRPFPSQHQDAETIAFVFTFAIALPAALLLVTRVDARVGRERFVALAGVLVGVALAGVVILKLADSALSVGGPGALLAVSTAWLAVAAAAIVAAWRLRISPQLDRLTGLTAPIWAIAGLLAVVAVLCFADLRSLAMVPTLLGLAAVAAVLIAYRRRPEPLPGPSRAAGIAIDVAVVVLLLLAVPNLLIFDPADRFTTEIVHFHQDFFLGPANHVLGGGAMLVDTLSQYGVASIYLIVAWFQIAPIGDGTLGFLDNALQALVFVAAFAVLRLAGVPRWLSVATMVVAVVALVFGLDFAAGALLQHGAIRFGMPILLILAATLEFARPRYRRPAQALQLFALGLSAIWALEAFAYTLVTAAAVLAVRCWLAPPERRRGVLGRWAAASFASCVAFHVALAAGTLIFAGELPRWGWYLNTLREFLTGSVGELTYDFAPWSAAFMLGALLVAAVAALVLLMRGRPDLARERPARTIAMAGSAAWGIALFSYFVNRSAEHITPYISLPAAILVALWLALVLDRRTGAPMASRLVALGATLALGVFLIGTAWPAAGTRFSQSALAYAIPGGGPSLQDGLHRLWNPPDLSPGASAGAELLQRCVPDPDRSYVLTDADLGIEILTKAERSNAFPLSDPWEDSLVPYQHIDQLQEAIDDLHAGDRLLLDRVALDTFGVYRRQPDRDPIENPPGTDSLVPSGIATLQGWLLKEVGERYRLKTVCGPVGERGLRVVELEPRG